MRQRKQTKLRWVFRYLAGRPLDGYPRSNSTWLRAGTEPASGESPGRWSLLPGWQRSAARTLPPVAVAAAGYGWAYYRAETAAVLIGLAVAGVIVLVDTAVRWFRRRRHHRTYVRPLVRTLSRELGVAYRRPADLVSVPVDFQDEDAEPVRITLPTDRNLSPELKERIRSIVAQRLGLHDASEGWSTIGPAPVATFRPAPRPPARVSFADVLDAVRAAPEHAPVLGIGTRNRIVDADFEEDSPHIAISAGSGGGKSVLSGMVLIHALHHGAGVVVFDYKRSSQKPFEGMPGVVIVKNIDEIHDWAVRLGEECERRNRAADEPGGFVGHRIILLVEEWNALAGKLISYWEKIRTREDPKKSPAVTAISDLTFMGRHVRMNLIGVAQLLTARTTGGPEVRENFATRCLTRYTRNAWKMLADVDPMPKKSSDVGRWQIVKGGEAHETQVAYPLREVAPKVFVLVDAAREWAMSGVANPVEVLSSQRPSVAATLPEQAGTVPVSQPPAYAPVGLRDAVESGHVEGVSLAQLRKWRTRHGETFPEPIGTRNGEDLYEVEALRSYVRRRAAVSVVRGDRAS
jgi:hypothetical protein